MPDRSGSDPCLVICHAETLVCFADPAKVTQGDCLVVPDKCIDGVKLQCTVKICYRFFVFSHPAQGDGFCRYCTDIIGADFQHTVKTGERILVLRKRVQRVSFVALGKQKIRVDLECTVKTPDSVLVPIYLAKRIPFSYRTGALAGLTASARSYKAIAS